MSAKPQLHDLAKALKVDPMQSHSNGSTQRCGEQHLSALAAPCAALHLHSLDHLKSNPNEFTEWLRTTQ